MAPELRHLRYLLAVAEHGNFTRAAEELRISQPTLSQQVKQLERTVGVQLLDRTGRSVRLTDAGETYAHYARRALRDLAAAERAVLDIADLSRGSLRLAVTPTFTAYLVGPLVAELHSRHPGIALDVRELAQDRIEAGLLADELDLGIAFDGPHLPGIEATALFTETLGLVVGAPAPDAAPPALGALAGEAAPPALGALAGEAAPPTLGAPASGGALAVRELSDRQLALLSGDFATRGHIDAYLGRHRVTPRIAVEANSIQALTEIVRRTPLATVLPDAVTHDHPHLAPVALDPPLPARTVALLRRESAYRSAAAREFIRLTRDLVRARGYAPA
ncbi:transcriptional regulator CynR [Streptomyces violascens]|uniref:transcriptional regulator CynR n=1 Tax=Streptomyces violascens TaxID=67381 RepID=UPI0036C2AD9F